MAPAPTLQACDSRGHAIVLGASLAGLAAAAALARRVERVTLVDRDEPAQLGEGRPGVPQGCHAHLLLPAGLRAIEQLAPGFTAEVQAHGGHVIPASEFRFHIGVGRLALSDDTLTITGATRPLLEAVLRQHVEALAPVRVLDRHQAVELLGEESASRIVGVRVDRPGPSPTQRLLADLVVDATGRRSRLPHWLEALGRRPPREERMEVGVHYSTRLFRRHPTDLGGCRHVAIAAPPGVRHGGLALAVEDDRWLVTLVGTVGERPPIELDEFAMYARQLWRPDLGELVEVAEALDDGVTGGFPAHRRRHYELLRDLPERLVVVGDAMCSLSPVYGQGMTVAALEAQALGEVIDAHGLDRVGRRYHRGARRIVDRAWSLATGADLGDPGIDVGAGPAGGSSAGTSTGRCGPAPPTRWSPTPCWRSTDWWRRHPRSSPPPSPGACCDPPKGPRRGPTVPAGTGSRRRRHGCRERVVPPGPRDGPSERFAGSRSGLSTDRRTRSRPAWADQITPCRAGRGGTRSSLRGPI